MGIRNENQSHDLILSVNNLEREKTTTTNVHINYQVSLVSIRQW